MISDIHGHLDPFMRLLKEVNYSPNHDQLILIGDYVDRGPKSKQVIEFVRELVNEGAVALRGNHDDWFFQFITDPLEVSKNFYIHGGIETIESYVGDLRHSDFNRLETEEWAEYIRSNHAEDVEFLKNLNYYYEHDDFICVHAGIDPNHENWKDTSTRDFLWIRDEFIKATNLPTEKTIIFGHTPTVNIQKSPDIYFAANKIGIDGGYTFGYQMNCLIYENQSFKSCTIK